MIEFPSFLPSALLLSVRNDSGSVGEAFEMESGPKKMRPKFTKKNHRVGVQWDFTKSEFEKFQFWHKNLLKSGSLEFTMLMVNGAGLNTFTLRFSGPWSATIRPGLRFLVSAELDSIVRPGWNSDAYDAYAEYGESIINIEVQFDQIITFELPQEF